MSDDERAIPFVEMRDGKFHLNAEAVAFVESLPQPLSVIAVAGGYREGKSFFLNRGLLQTSPSRGFGVGNTTNACTKGLWIHTSRMQVAGKVDENGESLYTNVLVIDTEGLGAFDADDSHDTKIFALALLLCSYFIYNSIGKIDEESIGRLSLVANVCKQVRADALGNDDAETHSAKRRRQEDDPVTAESTTDDSFSHTDDATDQLQQANKLGKYFPAFLWLLRDFSLLMQDAAGNSITPTQYLESALADKVPAGGDVQNKQWVQSIAEKNHLRRMLRTVFDRRDCAMLKRPCVDEQDLQRLDSLPDSALRPEFLTALKRLRRKVVLEAPPKVALGGKPVSGRGLVQLCRSYIDAFNRGAAPVIRDSWNMLREVQCRDAIDAAADMFTRRFASLIAESHRSISRVQLDQAVQAMVHGAADGETLALQVAPVALEQMFTVACDAARQHYHSMTNDDPATASSSDSFVQRLEAQLRDMVARVRTHNARGLECKMRTVLETIERQSIEPLFAGVEKQLTDARDTDTLTHLRLKPLWEQLLEAIDDAAQEQLEQLFGAAKNDAIIKSLWTRTVAQRHIAWFHLIEARWLSLLTEQCSSVNGQLGEARKEALRLTQVVDAATEKLQAQTDALADLEARLQSESERHELQKKQREESLAQREELFAQQVGALETSLQSARGDVERLETELQASKEASAAVESEHSLVVQKLQMERDAAVESVAEMTAHCSHLSERTEQLHTQVEESRKRLQECEQAAAQLRSCRADLAQARAEQQRLSSDYGKQLAQLESDSVASISKIRSTNERTRREQEERIETLDASLTLARQALKESKETLDAQISALTEKLVTVRNEQSAENKQHEQTLALLQERTDAAEQEMLEKSEEHRRAMLDVKSEHEQLLKEATAAAREEARAHNAERIDLLRKVNEAETAAACAQVRNEHLQAKLQDEASKGELQQAKRDLQRSSALAETLRAENEEMSGKQRAHQHELAERERRIDQMQKKLQEQEREFSAERLRLRLRIEEENAQSYRKSLTTPSAKKN